MMEFVLTNSFLLLLLLLLNTIIIIIIIIINFWAFEGNSLLGS